MSSSWLFRLFSSIKFKFYIKNFIQKYVEEVSYSLDKKTKDI